MKENIPGGSRYRTLNWPPSTYRATRSTATGTTRSLQVEKFALAEGLIDRVIYGRALTVSPVKHCIAVSLDSPALILRRANVYPMASDAEITCTGDSDDAAWAELD